MVLCTKMVCKQSLSNRCPCSVCRLVGQIGLTKKLRSKVWPDRYCLPLYCYIKHTSAYGPMDFRIHYDKLYRCQKFYRTYDITKTIFSYTLFIGIAFSFIGLRGREPKTYCKFGNFREDFISAKLRICEVS